MESLLPKRRKRTVISPEQLKKLEHLFEEEQWPCRVAKARLADELGQTENFVNIWFQNKRARVKKEQGKRVKALLEQTTASILQPGDKDADNQPETGPSTVSNAKAIPNQSVQPSIGLSTNKSRPENVSPVAPTKPTPDRKRPHCDVDEEKSEAVSYTDAPLVSEKPQLLSEVNVQPENGPKPKRKTEAFNVIKLPSEKQPKPRPELQTPSPSPSGPSLFHSIIRMMALVEGGILRPGELAYGNTISNALYGVKLKDGARLVYNKDVGLEVKEEL